MIVRWMVILAGLALLCGGTARAELRPARLRCEYRVNPLGIDIPRPRLSWIVESRQRNERQTAYQVLVAGSEAALRANRGDLWDSGRVSSGETVHIPYSGKALGSEQECWWKVRSWDRNGRPSAYSAPARWSMGLLQPTDWKARWISLEALPPAEPDPAASALQGLSWVWFPEGNPAQSAPAAVRYFRTQISLPEGRTVRSARFALTADDEFTLFINGQRAGRGTSWRQLRVLDVAQRLRPGDNILAIAARNTAESPAGLVGQLTVEFAAGEPLVVPISRRWKSAREAGSGWQSAWFNDEAWAAAQEIARVGDQPWGVPGTAALFLPPSPYVRKSFEVNRPVRRAVLYATALGLYELHLNGRQVGDEVFSPGWTEYRKRVYYQTYDVTRLLRRGENALGFILGDGWAVGYVGLAGRENYGVPRPRLLAQLQITYNDGATDTLVTDNSWKAAYGPILEGDMLMGETFDARQERAGWDRPGFTDSGWQPVVVHAPWPAKIEAYPGVPVRKLMELKPQKVTEPTAGAYVFDLGQNMVGWARLAVTGPAGTKVRLRFAEMLNPDGTIYTTNLRSARATDTYTLKGGGREVWEPRFTFHGFRYVEVTGYPGRPPAAAITGVVVYSDTPRTGAFTCSNPMVNQLQQNIEWGQRGNFLEVPTDCPQRDERLGWMGDAQVFVRTACYNMDVGGFFTKWMVDVEDAQRENGAFTDVAPHIAVGAGTAAWGDAGVIVPWTIYQMYGDRRIIERHYNSMARWIDFLEKNSSLLLRPAAGYGDWLSIGADTPKDVLATAYFAYSTSLLAKMAAVIGREADARRYEELFGRIRDAFNRAYVAADGRIKGNTQTVYVLALQMDLLPPEKRAAATRHLVEDIQSRGGHLSTGFVGTAYLNPVLTRSGETDVAYRLLNQDGFPSWGFSIKHGATTIWERWDGWTPERGFQDPGMNSFNHYSFGAVGQWLFGTVAGIQPDPQRPGFQHILIRPEPGGGLTWARASYDSLRGTIRSEWEQKDGRLILNVEIPANTTAAIHVPAAADSRVEETGGVREAAGGLRPARREHGAAVFEVGSGIYQFVVTRP